MFGGTPICRLLKYYVNAESMSTIELGTQSFPYKDLESAFAEILNLHSNTDRNITVFIHKGTQNQLLVNKVYIYNLYNISLVSYTDNNQITDRPLIIGVEASTVSKIYSMSTSYNILKNSTLLLSSAMSNDSSLTQASKNSITTTTSMF